MTEANGPPSLLERARLDISHLRLDLSEDLARALDSALRVSARTLGVTRVGVWLMTPDHGTLYRARVHDAARPDQTDDVILRLDRWPAYLEAITSRRVVAADDAQNDPRTAELRDDYLVRFGITSMLDAPLFLNGAVLGVVCHEHDGPARVWAPREIDFAISVADMLSALLGQSMLLTAERRLRESEARAAHARQLTITTRAASGIAHDVNTILQAISGHAEQARSADTGAREAALAAILEDCQRSARILDQLRDLERPRNRIDERLDLAEVIAGIRPTLETLVQARPGHTLTVDAAEGTYVAATRTDLERIVLNLVTNARDATLEGGNVTLVVRADGDDVVLEVRDHGDGLTPEDAARVFEPYWSTKGDRGGLGLFIVDVTSARSGGSVSVQSAPGQGATFVVRWKAK